MDERDRILNLKNMLDAGLMDIGPAWLKNMMFMREQQWVISEAIEDAADPSPVVDLTPHAPLLPRPSRAYFDD